MLLYLFMLVLGGNFGDVFLLPFDGLEWVDHDLDGVLAQDGQLLHGESDLQNLSEFGFSEKMILYALLRK